MLDLISRRPRRVRHRPLVDARRARGLRRRPARDARDVGRGDRATSSAAGPTTSTSSTGKHWSMPHAARAARSRCRSRTRRSGARRRASTATTRSASSVSGCCSFTVGVSPEELEKRIDIYRDAVADCTRADRQVRQQPGGDVHDGALRDTERAGARRGRGVVRVVPEGRRARSIASVAEWMEEGKPGARQLRLRGRGAARASSRACSTS